MSDNRFYLQCPFDEKEECKALGGRWDNDMRKWYVPSNLDKELFKEWWPENRRQPAFAVK